MQSDRELQLIEQARTRAFAMLISAQDGDLLKRDDKFKEAERSIRDLEHAFSTTLDNMMYVLTCWESLDINDEDRVHYNLLNELVLYNSNQTYQRLHSFMRETMPYHEAHVRHCLTMGDEQAAKDICKKMVLYDQSNPFARQMLAELK